ncbi:MAG: ChaN family lipoprotein [Bdellovibrionaceae bacterium]|nr:ChaN family lipoprotein [Bdellovibrio sp.]
MDSTQLVQIRKDFYNTIRKRVESIIGLETKDLQNYRGRYEKELGQMAWTAVDKKHLFARLASAQVVIVGDFHAQKQSTRGFLRIIRKLKTPLVLALECLNEADQGAINSYMKGSLSEKDFLSRVAWKKKWGFPWENYRPLFKWAQLHKVAVYGINSASTPSNDLSLLKRDESSAAIIKKINQLYPDKKILVQYGDLHLASAHLPKQIKRKMVGADVCVIYQSPEILYFKIMEKQKELSTDVVKLTNDKWALNGLPPWIKWQDYLLYLESGYDKRVKISDIDPTDSVVQSVELLSQSFGLNIDISSLSVYSANDDVFFEQISKLPLVVRKRVLENVQEGISFYLPELQVGYLARFSVNHVTRVASQYIYYKEKGFSKTIVDPKKEFLKLIWLEAVTYLCSKVTNPKRKTDTLQDIRTALQKEQFDDRGKEALMLSLTQKLSELQFLSHSKVRPQDDTYKKYNKSSFNISAQILGGILGEKFFYALNKKIIRFPLNKNLLFKDLQLSHFSQVYYESLEMVESWPVPFKSKYDRM